MVLFRASERPLTALDSSAPRLLRMAPLRHSLRMAPRLDAQDSDDSASTVSAPGYRVEDAGDGSAGEYRQREQRCVKDSAPWRWLVGWLVS